jgi:hypothetical protein
MKPCPICDKPVEVEVMENLGILLYFCPDCGRNNNVWFLNSHIIDQAKRCLNVGIIKEVPQKPSEITLKELEEMDDLLK